MAEEGGKIKIPILGIHRAGSEAQIKSGACNEVIGFVYQDGSLVPYAPVKTEFSQRGAEKIWVHKTSEGDNFIYLFYDRETKGYTLSWLSKADASNMDKTPEVIAIFDVPKQIDFLRNVLVISRDAYQFKKNKDGEFIYDKGTSVEKIANGIKLNLGIKGNGVAIARDMYNLSTYDDTQGKTKEAFKEESANIIKAINYDLAILEGAVKKRDYITGACYLRYAVRLYDGSYVNASKPVLVTADTLYHEGDKHYNSSPFKFMHSDRKHYNGTSTADGDSTSWKRLAEVDFSHALIGNVQLWYMINKKSKCQKVDDRDDLYLRYRHYFEGSTENIARDYKNEGSYVNCFWGQHYRYEKPVFDNYMIYGNSAGNPSFRERIGFGSSGFERDKYYKKKIKSDNSIDVTYANPDLYYTISSFDGSLRNNLKSGLNDFSAYDREKGWTWGMLPSVVSPNSVNIGESYISGMVSFAKPDICGSLLIKNFESLHGYGSSNSVPVDNVDGHYSDQDWYSTYFHTNGYLTNAFYTPRNYHIGEMAFGLHNMKWLEGEGENEGKCNFAMFMGRELYTPVYEIVELSEEFGDLVAGVDIFMTPCVSMHEDHKESDDLFSISAHRPYKTIAKIEEELMKHIGNFHKIHSINYKELKSLLQQGYKNKTIYPYIERGKISNVDVQPTLTEYGRTLYDFNVKYVYNGRLHISDVTDIHSNYYKDCLSEFCGIKNCYSEINNGENTPTTNRYNAIQNFANSKQQINNLLRQTTFGRVASLVKFRIVCVVELLIDGVSNKTYLEFPFEFGDEFPLGRAIFYPDKNAVNFRVVGIEAYEQNNGNAAWMELDYDFSLNSAEYGNFAYTLFLDEEQRINFFKLDGKEFVDTKYDYHTLELKKECKKEIKRDGNLFKVSAVNQPLVFPYAQTYTCGSGDIVGFSSNATAVSQGQFGAYPLYVFTTEGIYAMDVDTSGVGVYNKSTIISREVCNNPHSICQTEIGVFFSTDKGLMVLNGTQTELVSTSINGKPSNLPNPDSTLQGDGLKVYANAVSNAQLVELMGAISKEDFREYLSDKYTHVSYAYEKNKLVIFNPTYEYHYVIDLKDFVCTKLDVCIKFDTMNFPNNYFGTGIPDNAESLMEREEYEKGLEEER